MFRTCCRERESLLSESALIALRCIAGTDMIKVYNTKAQEDVTGTSTALKVSKINSQKKLRTPAGKSARNIVSISWKYSVAILSALEVIDGNCARCTVSVKYAKF